MVKIWFQNRRMKWRNSKERELLASGGSRDQTLPNKNNPNPDLSDARTDRAQSLSPPASPPPAIADQLQRSHSPQQQPPSPQATKPPLLAGGSHPVPKASTLINFKPKFEISKAPIAAGVEFKYEFDDISSNSGNGQQQQQQQQQQQSRPPLMNSFYANSERDRELLMAVGTGGGTVFSNRSNSCSSSDNISNGMYYDDYDSNTDDSDEEINVT